MGATIRACLYGALTALGVGLFVRSPALAAADAPYRLPPTTVSSQWQALWPQIAARRATGAARLPGPDDLAAWASARAATERALAPYEPAIVARYRLAVTAKTLAGVPVLAIATAGRKDDGRLVVYVHGGGFTALSAHSTLLEAALVARAAGVTVISIDYTPAPAARWRGILGQVTGVYRELLAEGHRADRIALMGDSAGGAIAAGATLELRDEGTPLPAALVLWAPWADISMTGDSYRTLAPFDPSLDAASLEASAAAYAPPSDRKNPYVSPVYGDYAKGFPPTLIQGGTREIFLSNCVRQYQAIVQAGMPATLDLYEGMPHVFQMAGADTPEGRAAVHRTAAFLDEHLGPPQDANAP